MPHSRARQAHTLLTATACAETPGYPRSHRRLLCGGPARTGRRASAGRKYLGSMRTTVSPARSPPATFPTSATEPCSPSHLRRRGGTPCPTDGCQSSRCGLRSSYRSPRPCLAQRKGRRRRRRATRHERAGCHALACRHLAAPSGHRALPAARLSRSPSHMLPPMPAVGAATGAASCPALGGSLWQHQAARGCCGRAGRRA